MDTISENIMPEEMPFSLSEHWLIVILLLVASLGGYWAYRYFSKTESFEVENQNHVVTQNHGENDPSNVNYCEGGKCYL